MLNRFSSVPEWMPLPGTSPDYNCIEFFLIVVNRFLFSSFLYSMEVAIVKPLHLFLAELT